MDAEMKNPGGDQTARAGEARNEDASSVNNSSEKVHTNGKDHGSRPADDALLARVPALLAYVRRVSAVRQNFRRYMVEADGGSTYGQLRRPVAVIRVTKDGVVSCTSKDHAPTPEEVKAIAEQVKAAKWPCSTPARKAQLDELRKRVGGRSTLLPYLDRSGKNLLFVQQRVIHDSGEKSDLPWSFWDDGCWRRMEPDGQLPLFGLDLLDQGGPVMIHEGASGADKVRKLVADPEALALHPWGWELRQWNHMAWPGGVFRHGDVDFSPIEKLEKSRRAALVLDRDFLGENVGPRISEMLGRPLSALRFDNRFPESFDLADEFPKEMWVDGRYRGPTLEQCLSPATYATEQFVVDKHLITKLNTDFASEWYCSIKPLKFIHRQNPWWTFDKEEFNALHAPLSHTDDVARLLRRSYPAQVRTTVYEPGNKPGLLTVDGQLSVNVFRPSEVKPKKGDVALWLEFMEYLLPVEGDRKEVMKFVATLIARPDVKMTYGLLLISEVQGVGKGTLGEKIIAPILGIHNCSFPSASQVTQSDFHSWRVNKRLTVVHELYDGETSKAYNRLKAVISDEKYDVNEKYEKPRYDLKNWTHVIACSNSWKPLKLAEQDRRWLIPQVTEEKKTYSFWKKLNQWLVTGGLEAIAHWAKEYVEENGHVEVGMEAPMTESKKKTVHAARSDGEKFIFELCTILRDKAKDKAVRLDRMRVWLASMKSSDSRYGHEGTKYLETPETISRVVREAGLKISSQRFVHDTERFKIVTVDELDEQVTRYEDIQKRIMTPDDIWLLDDSREENLF